jgi:hypothetical protein
MLAGQGQHRPGRTDQPPAQCPAGIGQPQQPAVVHPAQRQSTERRVCGGLVVPHHPAAAGVWQFRGGTELAVGGLLHHVVDNRSVRTRFAQQPEHQRYCQFGHVGQHVGPAHFGQCRVQFGTGCRQHGLAQSVFE